MTGYVLLGVTCLLLLLFVGLVVRRDRIVRERTRERERKVALALGLDPDKSMDWHAGQWAQSQGLPVTANPYGRHHGRGSLDWMLGYATKTRDGRAGT